MADDSQRDAGLEAWAALLQTERGLENKIEDHLKKAELPPLDWYHVLEALDASERGMLRQTSLQKRTELAQYNVCRLIDRLEREHLVERDSCPVDARNNVVAITDKGRSLRRTMSPVYAGAVDAHLGTRLTAAEALQLKALLSKLQAE